MELKRIENLSSPSFRQRSDRVVFLHIPKTAGTSFHLLLSSYFPAEEICPCRNRTLEDLSMEDLHRYTVFSGHYLFDQIQRIPDPKITVTFLRDPQRRLISLYNYQRSFRWDVIPSLDAEGYDSPRFAKTLPLPDYLRCNDLSVKKNVDNAIARYLIGSRYVKVDGNLALTDDGALNLAIANLEKFNAIGILEKTAESMRRFAHVLNLPLPEDMGLHNDFRSLAVDARFERVEPLALDDSMLEQLKVNTRIDQKIYDWAIRSTAVRVDLPLAV